MEAKDLMIGDWFQTTYPSGRIKYRKVTAVFSGHVSCEDGTTNAIEPIPLTQKILKKNGFKLNHVAQWYLDEGEELGGSEIPIYLDETFDNEGFFWNVCGTLVKKFLYVNQLQHALRLCEINKEIQL